MPVLVPESPRRARARPERAAALASRLLRRSSRVVLVVTLAAALLPAPGAAQGFEGTVRSRSVDLNNEALLWDLVPDEVEERAYDLDPDAMDRMLPDALFALETEAVLADGSGFGMDEVVEVSEETLHVKGGRIRQDVDDDEMGIDWVLFEDGGREVVYVSDAERFFVRIDVDAMMNRMREQMRAMGMDPEAMMGAETGPGSDPPGLEDLGRTATVNGFPARAYRVSAGEEISLVWASEGHDGLVEAMRAAVEAAGEIDAMGDDGSADPEVLVLEETGALPVRTVTLRRAMGGGFDGYALREILSVEETEHPEAFFEIPPGYEERSMEAMMGMDGFGGAG